MRLFGINRRPQAPDTLYQVTVRGLDNDLWISQKGKYSSPQAAVADALDEITHGSDEGFTVTVTVLRE